MKNYFLYAFMLTVVMAFISCSSNGSKDIELKIPTEGYGDNSQESIEIIQLVPGTGKLKWRKDPQNPSFRLFSMTVRLRKNADVDTTLYKPVEELHSMDYQIVFKDIDDQYINFNDDMEYNPISISPGLTPYDTATETAKLRELFYSPVGTEMEITLSGYATSNEEKMINNAVTAVLTSSLHLQKKDN